MKNIQLSLLHKKELMVSCFPLSQNIRALRKVKKTRHQNPKFGPKPGEIQKKNLQKSKVH
jgi:hypothetical protein